jgi:hypothetical protein
MDDLVRRRPRALSSTLPTRERTASRVWSSGGQSAVGAWRLDEQSSGFEGEDDEGREQLNARRIDQRGDPRATRGGTSPGRRRASRTRPRHFAFPTRPHRVWPRGQRGRSLRPPEQSRATLPWRCAWSWLDDRAPWRLHSGGGGGVENERSPARSPAGRCHRVAQARGFDRGGGGGPMAVGRTGSSGARPPSPPSSNVSMGDVSPPVAGYRARGDGPSQSQQGRAAPAHAGSAAWAQAPSTRDRAPTVRVAAVTIRARAPPARRCTDGRAPGVDRRRP